MPSDCSGRRALRVASAAVAGGSAVALAGCSSTGLGLTCKLRREGTNYTLLPSTHQGRTVG